ncbi:MAG: lipopolysaccharide kinase InaA family protein [bacterium]
MNVGSIPAGYVRVAAGRRVAVVHAAHVDDASAMLSEDTLHQVAARSLSARPLQGRGIAYAIALPMSKERVVVRHNQHGGLLAGLTRDLFLPPSRAPYELSVSLRLADAGVRTPDVLMYGVEPVAGMFCRSDVVTREVLSSRDLSSYMHRDEPVTSRADAWTAARTLVDDLTAAGARHRDLNVKNVLLAPAGSGMVAYVLDVDRVTFGAHDSAEVRTGNVERLLRSARKWRHERGAVLDEKELLP